MKPRLFRSLSNKNTELNKEIDKAKYFFANIAEILEAKKEKSISASFTSKLEAYKKLKPTKKEKDEIEKTNTNIAELAEICLGAKNNKNYPDAVRLLASRIYHLCNSIVPRVTVSLEQPRNEREEGAVVMAETQRLVAV